MPEAKDSAQATARTPGQGSTGEAAKLYAERSQRIADAMALRQPDRVPLIYNSQFWLAAYSGISFRQAMYDYEALAAAIRKVVLDFEPDAYVSPFPGLAVGPVLDQLGYRALEWPGHGVPDNRPYQYIDREYMTADDYDAFTADPNWYIFARFLPRVSEAYAPLAKLPELAGSTFLRQAMQTRKFATPEVAAALRRLIAAGEEAQRATDRAIAFDAEMAARGFPLGRHASTSCPYDYFADYLRGSKGAMLDLRRRGDKLLAAMEKVIPFLLADAMAAADANGGKIVFFPLHWGLGGFMSLEHFKIFYWPQLRQMMMGLVARGYIPMIFWEGDCASRLETIADIPPGTCVYCFEQTDMFRAKEVLGSITCLRGNVPPSMLSIGSPEEVRDYCRKLIDVVGKGGGFLLDGATGIPDEARPENVRAMYETAKTYGRYD
jgi:hypothetical protein